MINPRAQVANLLLTVCENVNMSKPDADAVFPFISYSLQSDLPVNVAYDRLRWRVACYARTFTELLELCDGVMNVMTGQLGFTLTSITPDEDSHKETNLFMKRLDFSGLVDKKTLGVLRGAP
mgnify:CR=1 FL=1